MLFVWAIMFQYFYNYYVCYYYDFRFLLNQCWVQSYSSLCKVSWQQTFQLPILSVNQWKKCTLWKLEMFLEILNSIVLCHTACVHRIRTCRIGATFTLCTGNGEIKTGAIIAAKSALHSGTLLLWLCITYSVPSGTWLHKYSYQTIMGC